MNRKAQRAALITEAAQLATKAQDAGPDLTADEQKRALAIKSEVAELDRLIKADDQARAAIKAMTGDSNDDAPPAPGAGRSYTPAHPLAKAIVAKLADQPGGLKGITTTGGSIEVPHNVGIAAAPADARLLQQLVRWVNAPEGGSLTYLRQVGTVQPAQPVEVGGDKPEASIAFERVNQPFATLAHTIPVPKQWLDDVPSLRQLIEQELTNGVLYAVDDMLLSDTEPAEDGTTLHGILTTTGVQAQPFTTDQLTTLANAVQLVTDAGHNPSAIAMAPADWTALQLLQATGSGNFLLPGIPTGPGVPSLFGVPVVLSPRLEAGTALVGDWAEQNVGIATRGPIQLQWDPFSLSTTNRVRLRVEGRFSPMVVRPAAFAVATLTGSGD